MSNCVRRSTRRPVANRVPIYIGGPVQTDRGFVLHPTGPTFQATVDLDGVSLSTSQDVLFAIADGVGPEQSVDHLGATPVGKQGNWRPNWPAMPG